MATLRELMEQDEVNEDEVPENADDNLVNEDDVPENADDNLIGEITEEADVGGGSDLVINISDDDGGDGSPNGGPAREGPVPPIPEITVVGDVGGGSDLAINIPEDGGPNLGQGITIAPNGGPEATVAHGGPLVPGGLLQQMLQRGNYTRTSFMLEVSFPVTLWLLCKFGPNKELCVSEAIILASISLYMGIKHYWRRCEDMAAQQNRWSFIVPTVYEISAFMSSSIILILTLLGIPSN